MLNIVFITLDDIEVAKPQVPDKRQSSSAVVAEAHAVGSAVASAGAGGLRCSLINRVMRWIIAVRGRGEVLILGHRIIGSGIHPPPADH